MTKIYQLILANALLFCLLVSIAYSAKQKEFSPSNFNNTISSNKTDYWGIALTVRSAEIPYSTSDGTVSDVVPLLFYKKGRFFWRGTEAGYTFADYQQWNLSLLGRQRFFDIPAEFQNKTRGSGADVGLRYRYNINPSLTADLEVMDDLDGRRYANVRAEYTVDHASWKLIPYIKLRYKTKRFNDFYYGLATNSIGSDYDLSIGGTVRYHVISNFYLLSRFSITQFAAKTKNSVTMDSARSSEIYAGVAFFNIPKNPTPSYLKAKPYVRVAHGTATPSSLGEIIKLQHNADPFNNTMLSVFYGIPISDTLFGINLPLYFTPGYVHHNKSSVQPSIFSEYVIAIKGFYTVKLPFKLRFGFAEGLSFASKITYIEQTEMDKNNYRASKLLNYLDASIDIDLGDVFNSKKFKNLWAGYSIHHRSGIFETSSAFGRIKGGSNYTSFYLQYHW
ncbi:hypothetical protein MNBD_GAMMA22-1090 [hydrothermal vent metagenome]|uniref:MipA/OmpV family protein n=1 Tax=hydrothermal vent metagenome TaxID=652676 RepID=A0A3B1B114_9ZZZZ